MLFRWLAKAIRDVEGGITDAETFEDAYWFKYQGDLELAGRQFGWPPKKLATAFGEYQILGENLARHHGFSVEHLDRFLTDSGMQYQVAHKQFNIMLRQLVKRRGWHWPKYIFSMWNAGVNYNENYTLAIKARLKG